MERRYTSCSFTGHRQIPSEDFGEISRIVEDEIERAYNLGCRVFYSGGALGFDTLAARTVIRFRMSHLDVSLVLLLPCVNQDAKWSFSQREDYSFVLREADEIRYLSDEYTDSCMRLRNQMLADSCDLLIAYVTRYKSGAAQTLRMAERLGCDIRNIGEIVP